MGDGRNMTGKYGQAQMTEPKHEEQGECVAGQFIECHVHRHSGSVSNSLSV